MAKTKYFDIHAEAIDKDGHKHVVTLVGELEQGYVSSEVVLDTPIILGRKNINGSLTFQHKVFNRTLTIGMSICHPDDTFDEEYGIKLAKKRIQEGKDIGSVNTNDVTMLTKDLVYMELLGKLRYITQNIDKYIRQ